MIVELMPTFYCKQMCNYCYLGSLRHSSKILTIEEIEKCLGQVPNIEGIDLFGGELTLLNRLYLTSLINLCKKYSPNISVVSSLFNMDSLDCFNSIKLGISYNKQRPDYKQVRYKVSKLQRDFGLIHVVMKSDLTETPDTFLRQFNFPHCKEVSLVKFYPTENHPEYLTADKFQQFLMGIFNYYVGHKNRYFFNLTNLFELDQCVKGNYHTHNATVFINPEGKFGTTVYNDNGYESFKWFDSYTQFSEYKETEYMRCMTCKYKGQCYAEHIVPNECNGSIKLIEWYKEQL